MWSSVTDLGVRQGTPLEGTAADWWRSSEALIRLLVEEATEWWVAELPASGKLVGFARSIERDGLVELTEFFVRPDQQSRGIGRALMERAFPAGRGEVRSIIATSDVRAQARYYAAGTVARFPFFTMGGAPTESVSVNDLTAEPIEGAQAIQIQREIERRVLGHRRSESEIHSWLGAEATCTGAPIGTSDSLSWGAMGQDRWPRSTRQTCQPSCYTSRMWLGRSASNVSSSKCPRPTRSASATSSLAASVSIVGSTS
jgi:GNAT superfamily N-acetyltransferase